MDVSSLSSVHGRVARCHTECANADRKNIPEFFERFLREAKAPNVYQSKRLGRLHCFRLSSVCPIILEADRVTNIWLVLGLFSTSVLNQHDNPQVIRLVIALQAIIWTNCGVGMFFRPPFLLFCHFIQTHAVSGNIHNDSLTSFGAHSACI